MTDSVLQTLDHALISHESLDIRDCGLVDYRTMLERQLHLCRERQLDRIPNTILMVEHPTVITLGARQSRNKLLVTRSDLTEHHVDVVDIRRGGGTTAHNPGQLVFYPILHLQQVGLCIRDYISKLEAIGVELLRSFDMHCTRNDGFPGLWVKDRKIASIGVRVSRFVTFHGMAINIQNDLGLFDYIVPCGLDHVEMTSVLKETGKRHSMREVKKRLASILTDHFSDGR